MSEGIRLNAYIASCGVASRRAADKLIEEGRVRLNGQVPLVGCRVMPGDEVTLNGEIIVPETRKIVIAVNKPIGVVCTEAHFKGEKTLTQLVDYPTRLFSIGRLDKDSEGLILMTNDGDLSQELSRGAAYHDASHRDHEKEYEVALDKDITSDFLEQMRAGVDIEIDGKIYTTKPCKVRKVSARICNIILTQGFNRQIRRMTRALGYHVRGLKRIRVENITLGDLPVGGYRELTEEEIRILYGR